MTRRSYRSFVVSAVFGPTRARRRKPRTDSAYMWRSGCARVSLAYAATLRPAAQHSVTLPPSGRDRNPRNADRTRRIAQSVAGLEYIIGDEGSMGC
eukprot:1185611-Prorocentrum_minimum.AAC.6